MLAHSDSPKVKENEDAGQSEKEAQMKTAVAGRNVPATAASFIHRYMQFLSHSRRSHSRRGKNSILLLFLKYKI